MVACRRSLAWWWRAALVRRHTKSRGHHRGAAAPGVSVPWRPRFVVSDAPSRAPGPVPPGRAARASSSTPRRRCGGACENHTHIPDFMQPFPAGLAGPLARWYTSPVPPPSSSRTPGPLANLPRPLDERERGRGRGRRVVSVIGLAALVGVTAVLAHAVLPAMVSPVGEVAGAAATAEPAPVAAVDHGGDRPRAPRSRRPARDRPVRDTGAGDRRAAGRARPDPVLLQAAALTGYRWPLAHGRITLPFGPTAWGTRVVDGKLFHDGIDLATFCGDRVVAAHAGKVIAVGRHFDDAMGWVGDLRPYYKRLDAKHLWYELPIVVVVADGNGTGACTRISAMSRSSAARRSRPGSSWAMRAGPAGPPAATSTTGCTAPSRPRRSRSNPRWSSG